MKADFVPEFSGELRRHAIRVPESVYSCPGIIIFGRRIKSLVFTTDLAILRNCNADAVLAVYPFTPQPVIIQSLLMAADIPVFAGVGGGTTRGARVVELAAQAEFQGAMAVVVNSPTVPETIRGIRARVDLPVVCTVVDYAADVSEKIAAGAAILNVSAASRTPETVARLRDKYPDIPIIATGGPTDESILATVDAGANAVTWTPPSSAELFKGLMGKYRMGQSRE